jgi:dihydroorotate dehydrogenase
LIWSIAAPLARALPGELAHRLAVASLACGIGPDYRHDLKSDRLKLRIAGINFDNPLGLAAGFDKDAEAMRGALKLGFGFVEVGTITPKAQPGNPKPRVFRLTSDGAVINRYGFNNDGMNNAVGRLAAFRQSHFNGIVGVNIGANKDSDDRVADYHKTAHHLSGHADYVVVNVSSPNTPELRSLQEVDMLKKVLDAAKAGMKDANTVRPLFLKIAPDLDDRGLHDVLDVAVSAHLSGMIISNTTVARPDTLTHHHKEQVGGLSGRPLLMPSSAMVLKATRYLKSLKRGDDLALIAAGGVYSAESAYLKILLGASLVQVYTAISLEGFQLPAQIIRGLDDLLVRDGHKSVEAARGSIPDLDEALRHVGLKFT